MVLMFDRYRLNLFSTILLFFILLLPAFTALAQSEEKPVSPSASHEEAKIELIAGKTEGTSLSAGLHITMKEGWKTYWKNPGDGGLPLKVNWQGSDNINIDNVSMQWPHPKRFISYGNIENFGYKNEVVLPLDMTVTDPDKPIKLRGKVDYAVCEEICVFFSDILTLEVPEGFNNEENTALINGYKSLLPGDNGTSGLKIDDIAVLRDEDSKYGTIEITATSASPFEHPDIFIVGNPNIRFPKPDISYSNGNSKAVFATHYEKMIAGITLADQSVTVTLTDGNKSVEHSVNTGQITKSHNLYVIMLFAFIGGLILNIMPCVLPVLSLKIFGVIQHGGKHYSRVRASFLSSAAGIIISFLVLAAIVTGIQSTGQAIGWGFHFQEPLFLITIVVILTFFAANMWGLFEIPAPTFVNNFIPKEDDHTLLGHFLIGALATLLATPCSAPFLGTAIGFAFSQGATEIFMTFAVMGVGLAFPYLLVAANPRMVSALPKPGHWMVTFKSVLGVFLAVTALWLIWVLNGSLGMISAVILLAITIMILFVLMLFKNGQIHPRIILTVLLVGALLSYALPLAVAKPQHKTYESGNIWTEFEQGKIAPLVEQGKIVFVDVTADWCLTCKANKLLVLDKEDMINTLSAPNIVAMRADWTNPNAEIADYLGKYNRHGIPFNIVYGPSAPNGIVLSELLTKDAVLNALKQAE